MRARGSNGESDVSVWAKGPVGFRDISGGSGAQWGSGVAVGVRGQWGSEVLMGAQESHGESGVTVGITVSVGN